MLCWHAIKSRLNLIFFKIFFISKTVWNHGALWLWVVRSSCTTLGFFGFLHADGFIGIFLVIGAENCWNVDNWKFANRKPRLIADSVAILFRLTGLQTFLRFSKCIKWKEVPRFIKPQLAIARLRLHASELSICLSVCLSVCLSPKCKKTRFSQKLSNLELWCLFTTYRKQCKLNWAFQRTHYLIPTIQDGWKSIWRHFFLPRVAGFG